MNDKELADRLVQAGFKEGGFGYWIPGTSTQCNASLFVRDPRAAMGCLADPMFNIRNVCIDHAESGMIFSVRWLRSPRAICEAYVKAMEGE